MNLWAKMYAAKRRAIDRALLASMEREIAQAERAKEAPWSPDTVPVHQITEEERRRISRAFGRPL